MGMDRVRLTGLGEGLDPLDQWGWTAQINLPETASLRLNEWPDRDRSFESNQRLKTGTLIRRRLGPCLGSLGLDWINVVGLGLKVWFHLAQTRFP